ncbi:MAG: ATP-binding cassette domain-containing protein [Betaproteobacteria bacterium]|nr:ATP-binding cassette domain-containing protein [Betaproteobacteria bacterium]
MATTQSRTVTPAEPAHGLNEDIDEKIFGKVFDRGIVRRFFGYIVPYRRSLWLAIGCVVLFTASQLAIPLLIGTAIDRALVPGALERNLLLTAALAFALAIAVNAAASLGQEVIVGKTGERILFDLRRAMYAHLQRLSMSFMDKTEVGRLMSRLQGDVGALQEFLDTLVTAFGDLLLLVGIVAVLLSLDVELAVLTLSVVAVLLIVRMIWLPPARRAFVRARQASSIVNGALAENINGVRTVQEMTREKVNFVRFERKARDYLSATLRAAKFSQVMIPIVDTLTGMAMAIVVFAGGTRVLDGTLELGVMVAFVFYVQRFFDPIRSLTAQYSVMQRAMASGQRIFEVLDVPVDVVDKPGARELDEIEPSIEFRNVTFGYVPERPVLHEVSFEVAPGETIALVGPTGSGKTSTAALIHRFYDVRDGQVLIGGHDVRDVTQHSLGRHVGMVLQEPFLFTDTIFENIRYCSVGATREQVIAAANAVGAHDFIMRLPQGYDTRLEQRGSNLSLGQRQLVSFARALVADTDILILDEATASIDSYTERAIQIAMKRLLAGRTAVVIAHRLATIRNADRIIVLQDGRIVETGTHQQLLDRHGLYHRLHAMNYASFDDVREEALGGGDVSATTT